MQKAASQALAFKLLAAASSLSVTAAFLAVAAPPVRAAQVGGVQGTVRDNAGKPIRSAEILLTPVGGGQPQHARSDISGYYSFAGVLPGAYTLQVKVVTFNTSQQPITVTQDLTSTVDFSLTKAEQAGGNGSRRIPLIPANNTSTTFPITARDEQREKSQPNYLYQTFGLLNYKPGVTTDSGQYPHVRGSDGNQINWSIDGIDLRDPLTHQFATNLVTAGIRTSNLISGGADASYGGAIGAYLNQISADGRAISNGRVFGGFIEETNGPGSKWNYSGGNVQLGGLLPGGKFDYAFSSILFKTHYGDNTQIGALNSSHDEVGKINYYIDPQDTVTTFFAHGAQNVNSFQTSGNSLFFDPDRVLTDPTGRQYISVRDLGSDFNDHLVQTYNLDHLTYKHNFGSSSYVQYRIYQLHQAIPNHEEGTQGFFGFADNNVTGNQLNYYNQLSKSNILQAGLEYKDAQGTYRRDIFSVQRGDLLTATPNRYSDRIYSAYPKDFSLYLADQLRAAQDRLTFNYGVRLQSTTYVGGNSLYADSIGQPLPSGYTTKSTDPRLGLSYAARPDLTFRTSYSIDSQDPDELRIERLGPEDVGVVGTSLSANPLRQSEDAQIGRGFSPLNLAHSKDFDLGVEKALVLNNGPVQGAYRFGVTGYKKYGYDIAFLTQDDYVNGVNNVSAAFPTGYHNATYNNDGTQHASGFEFTLRKAQIKSSDWNGYISYTNQVVRTNSSEYDTNYKPYFVNYLGSTGAFTNDQLHSLAHSEFAPSWDQRHTVAVVANKRLNKLISSTFILDAGSGLPFYPSATSNGVLGAVGNGFADIGSLSTGAAEFTQVPITLNDSGKLPPLNPVVGYTGWHYKISINTDFNLTPDFSLFLNVDNVFDKKTALSLATGTFSGEPYYVAPSAQYPQGQQVFRYQSKLTPIFLTFGFRQRF